MQSKSVNGLQMCEDPRANLHSLGLGIVEADARMLYDQKDEGVQTIGRPLYELLVADTGIVVAPPFSLLSGTSVVRIVRDADEGKGVDGKVLGSSGSWNTIVGGQMPVSYLYRCLEGKQE